MEISKSFIPDEGGAIKSVVIDYATFSLLRKRYSIKAWLRPCGK